MNCLEFRQRRLKDPRDNAIELVQHLEACVNCRRFNEELNHLDDGIRQAFHVPLPENLDARILLKQSFERSSGKKRRFEWRWISGIAATLVVGVAFLAATLRPETATAVEHKLVAHVGTEEMLVTRSGTVLDQSAVQAALDGAGIASLISMDDVIHARTCIIDGQLVAHLIVRDSDGQFTILLTPFDVAQTRTFTEGRWQGVIKPTGFGAIAILASNGASNDRLYRLLDEANASIHATGD